MRRFFVGVLGFGACTLVAGQALAQTEAAPPQATHATSASGRAGNAKKSKRAPKLPKRRIATAGPARATAIAVAKAAPAPKPVAGVRPHPASLEPPPAGEQAVFWAQPKLHPGVKIRLAPSRDAVPLGEMRGDTAVAIRLGDSAAPSLLMRSGCRAWLHAMPEGYVCLDEVQLQAGYLSDPPTLEKPNGWQRLRYGVVKVASAVLEHNPGPLVPGPLALEGQPSAPSAGYLRNILHRGDGITVVKELADRVQVYGKKWLRKMDVALVTPPALSPINMQAVPPAQRFLVAWAVPAAGETQVALYPTSVPEKGRSAQPLWIPRYSQLWWTDGKASPGRVAVYLTDETRATLGTRPDSATPVAAPAMQYEIDAKELRRVTPVAMPAGLVEGERWIDISLGEQVAVAYLGSEPLFAALVSTGKGTTPPGSFFIYRKYLTQTMANLSGSASQYDFREVPYAQFFNGRIGLHAVLWHDLLGHPVSHGCVNMSPTAAEQFFSFTKPEMPPGWHTVNSLPPPKPTANTNFRGTRVVVRR